MQFDIQKLGRHAATAFDALLKSPLVEQEIAKAESQDVAHRAGLVAKLEALPGEFAKQHQVAGKRLAAAEAALRKAEAELAQAKDEHQAATVGAQTPGLVQEREHAELLKELEATADERIPEFVVRLDRIKNTLNGNISPAAAAAWAAVDTARAQVLELRLQALTGRELAAALAAVKARLVPVLAVLGLARALDDEAGPVH